MPLTGDGQFLDLQYFLGLLIQLLHVLDLFLLEGKSNVAQQFLILQFLVEESGPQLRNFLLGLVNFLLKLLPLGLIFSVAALQVFVVLVDSTVLAFDPRKLHCEFCHLAVEGDLSAL